MSATPQPLQAQLEAELRTVSQQRDELLARLSEPLQQLALLNGIIQALSKTLTMLGDETVPPVGEPLVHREHSIR